MPSEFTELGHFRLSPTQKRLGREACKIAGVKAAAKVRELFVEWCKNTLAEHKLLIGNKK